MCALISAFQRWVHQPSAPPRSIFRADLLKVVFYVPKTVSEGDFTKETLVKSHFETILGTLKTTFSKSALKIDLEGTEGW